MAFESITPDLGRLAIELPSWAFGNSGTRFKVFNYVGGLWLLQESLGNVLIQARAHGAMPASLEAMRGCVARSMTLRRFEPR